jgi:hypothetical protein
MTKRQVKSINHQGNEAAKKGIAVEKNPHKELTPGWYAWQAGWIMGHNEKLKITRLMQLEAFFQRIRTLTSNHDVIHDHACVTARKLGYELEQVDPLWWKDVPQPTKEDIKNIVDVGNET